MLDFLNPFISTFDGVQRQFYELADWSPVTAAYVKAQRLNMEIVQAFAGTLAVLPCVFDNGFFDIVAGGEMSVVFEVLDEDGARTIDLLAFPVADPTRFGTADGTCAVLGAANIGNPASWAFNEPMPIHRTPLKWLQSGCRGVVITDHVRGPVALSKALGNLGAEDMAHARDLTSMLCQPLVDPRCILVPHTTGVVR